MAVNNPEFFTVAGASLGLSATLPATEDVAGYEALSFTNLGEVPDLGSGLGRTYNIVTSNAIDRRRTSKAKGSYDVGDLTITINMKADDPGQILLNAALLVDEAYAFELEFDDNPGGTTNTIVYFSALITTKPRQMGTIDNIVTLQVTLAVTTDEVVADAT